MEGLTMYQPSDRLIADQMVVSVGQINSSVVTLPLLGRVIRCAQDQVEVDLASRIRSLPAIAAPNCYRRFAIGVL